MANSAIKIPFYVSRDGAPFTGGADGMDFEVLVTIEGIDKLQSAPSIGEIGGGWYEFEISYGSEPFDAGDMVGVIDADKSGNSSLSNAERYIPVEIRLDYYGLSRLVNQMSQDKISGDMLIKDYQGNTIIKLGITDNESNLERTPGVVD